MDTQHGHAVVYGNVRALVRAHIFIALSGLCCAHILPFSSMCFVVSTCVRIEYVDCNFMSGRRRM